MYEIGIIYLLAVGLKKGNEGTLCSIIMKNSNQLQLDGD